MNKLIFFTFFLLPCIVFSKSPVDSLCLGTIKDNYVVTDSVTFFLNNSSYENIYIAISLEKKVGRIWKLFMSDIFQKEDVFMVNYVLCLRSLECRRETWPIKSYMLGKKKDQYRFKFGIGTKPSELKVKRYSNSFSVI